MSKAISLLLSLFVILANPPRLINVLNSENKYFSPTGTNGAPCPPNLISWDLKSQITFKLIRLDISGKLPIWYVNEFDGSCRAVWPCELTKSMLLIENSQMQRQTGAAVESFRNETVKVSLQAQEIYKEDIKQRLNEPPRELKNITGEEEVDA